MNGLLLFVGLWYGQRESKRKVWGRLEEGNQETAEIQGPDQNMDSIQWNKG
jgi:hypothetical protein